MADGHGGPRTPRNPAPVSGPGSMSKRTDGKQPARYMAGGEYGDGKDLMELQTSAPMQETRTSVPSMRRSAAGVSQPGPQVTPLFAPTQRPDEPMTAGSPFGPGPGPVERPQATSGERSLAQTLEKLIPYDPSGQLKFYYDLAVKQGW